MDYTVVSVSRDHLNIFTNGRWIHSRTYSKDVYKQLPIFLFTSEINNTVLNRGFTQLDKQSFK